MLFPLQSCLCIFINGKTKVEKFGGTLGAKIKISPGNGVVLEDKNWSSDKVLTASANDNKVLVL